MKKIVLIFLTFQGCAGAGLQEVFYKPQKGGVAWAKNGAWVAKESREKALQVGRDFCGSDIDLMKEAIGKAYAYSQTTFNGYGGATTRPVYSNYRYLTFMCKEP